MKMVAYLAKQLMAKKEKLTLRQKIILLFLPRLAWILLWLLYATCKNKFYIHEDVKKGNAIIAFWHGGLLMLPFLYRKMRKKPKMFVISSEHFDAELMVKLYGYYGFKAIRGSSSKGGIKVLIQTIEKLKKGFDAAISPDGPKGPYHSIANGIVAMAQKTNVNIIVIQAIPKKYWELKTWDKFKIPKPFSTIEYYSMPSFKIDKNINLENAKKIIYDKMMINPKDIFIN